MDITHLMKSLSANENENSVSNLKPFAIEIDNIHTDVVFGKFSDQDLLIVTQYEKLGCLLKVTQDQTLSNCGASQSVFSVKLLFGIENHVQQAAARYIAEKLNINIPLVIFLNLQDYKRQTILSIVEALLDIKKII